MNTTGVVPPRVGRCLAVILFTALASCGGDEDPPTTTSGGTTAAPAPTATTPSSVAGTTTTAAAGSVLSVTVRGGSVEGASRQRARLNQPVTVRVTSDVAEEVHVHGYDERFEVAPGRTGEVTFIANIPGVFEVEFERSHKLLFTLEVS